MLRYATGVAAGGSALVAVAEVEHTLPEPALAKVNGILFFRSKGQDPN
jgi:hypothetical protein